MEGWNRRHTGILLGAAASILLCVALGRWLVVESRLKSVGKNRVVTSTVQREKHEATSVGIAVVTRLVDVTW